MNLPLPLTVNAARQIMFDNLKVSSEFGHIKTGSSNTVKTHVRSIPPASDGQLRMLPINIMALTRKNGQIAVIVGQNIGYCRMSDKEDSVPAATADDDFGWNAYGSILGRPRSTGRASQALGGFVPDLGSVSPWSGKKMWSQAQ